MATGRARVWFAILAVTLARGVLVRCSVGQTISGPMVGQDEAAWRMWQAGLEAIRRGDWQRATTAIEALSQMDLSVLRLALMADRTGTHDLQVAVANKQLPDVAAKLLARIEAGRKQERLASDGWHYAAIGKFELADAHFRAFLKAGPDPVAALELAELNPTRHEILVRLVANTQVGPSAKAMLDLLARGEKMIRSDPRRIRTNIERLAGPPQAVYNATIKLIDSGEYAVPCMVAYLEDPQRKRLHAPIITCLPQIGRRAVGALCIALRTEHAATQRLILEALGKIGYPQALPYVQRLLADQKTDPQVKAACRTALQQIAKVSGRSTEGKDAAVLFYELAEQYYYDRGSLQADPREDISNVWYWRQGRLVNVEVPRAVFNEIMAMRCCEEALRLRPEYPEAIALWLAANFRREAQLGVASVDSQDRDPALEKDRTKPADFPRAIYFALAAGARYNQMVLARGLRDSDPAVVLGAVSALAATAGAGDLVGPEDIKQPLVETLSFPDVLIRVRAALALGMALPTKPFAGCQKVVPVLAEALSLTGKKHALVIEPDQQNLNRIMAVLREAGFEVVGEASLLSGLNRARQQFPFVDVIFLASDIDQPQVGQAVAELRKDLAFAATPVVILAKPQQTLIARRLALADERIDRVLAEAGKEGLLAAWRRVSRTAGRAELTDALALELAMQAAEALRLIAVSGSQVYEFSKAVPALIAALQHPDLSLRQRAASVLALSSLPAAQQAIARLALSAETPQPLRIAAFGYLASSARAHGCMLTEPQVDQLIETVMGPENLAIRTASSQALGALNLPGNKASQMIRRQYRG